MPNGSVRFDLEDGVATITLDRPETLNSMNDDLMQDLSSALSEVEQNQDVRVAVITGEGRGFCSGADLNNAAETGSDITNGTPAFSDSDFFNPALRSLHQCPVPTVARVHGFAAGGGLGIALACDIQIAVRSTFWIVPDMGATWSLPRRAGRARAMGMAMRGERISAEQAADWGLIWKCVDDENLDSEIQMATETLKPSTITTK